MYFWRSSYPFCSSIFICLLQDLLDLNILGQIPERAELQGSINHLGVFVWNKALLLDHVLLALLVPLLLVNLHLLQPFDLPIASIKRGRVDVILEKNCDELGIARHHRTIEDALPRLVPEVDVD